MANHCLGKDKRDYSLFFVINIFSGSHLVKVLGFLTKQFITIRINVLIEQPLYDKLNQIYLYKLVLN